jgi:hypothetical protein
MPADALPETVQERVLEAWRDPKCGGFGLLLVFQVAQPGEVLIRFLEETADLRGEELIEAIRDSLLQVREIALDQRADRAEHFVRVEASRLLYLPRALLRDRPSDADLTHLLVEQQPRRLGRGAEGIERRVGA